MKYHDIRDLKYGAEIIFNNGKTAFMQGTDAGQLLDEIDKCETAEQIHNILEEYIVLIEE
jgi:hypothetical protein